MPELPEVEVTRRGLAPVVEGAKIIGLKTGKPLRWPLGCEPEILVGKTIHAVRRRAKYLLLDLDDGLLLIHLGMSGRLKVANPQEPLTAHDHFDIQTTQGILRLHDPRRFGAVVWSPSEHEGMGLKLLGHLGMEPLGDAYNEAAFMKTLKQHSAAIKQVLLSGRVVVGVGNIYASEVLFQARIHPEKPANQISARKARELARAVPRVLEQAIACGGSTLKDFLSIEGGYGWFQIHATVYGRAGEPCTVCQRPIKSMQLGQRNTFFCSYCQRK